MVCDLGYKQDVGRVTEVRGETAFVCYTHGCTASATGIDLLRPFDERTDKDRVKDPLTGFHRFDADCPCYDETACYPACAERFGK